MNLTLDEMTRTGHNEGMPKVNVTKLKARLSHFLRLVRKGETVVVYDRDRPVAEIIPWREKRLRITPAEDTSGPWYAVPTGPPLPPEVAEMALRMLEEDRNREPAWLPVPSAAGGEEE